MKVNLKKYLPLIILVLILLAIPLTLILTQKPQDLRQKAAPAANLYFDQNNTTVTPNQQFTVNAMINTGVNSVAGVELHVTYEPAFLRLDSINLPATNPLFPNLMSSNIDPLTGRAEIIMLSDVTASNSGMVTGTGAIATLTFTPLTTTTPTSAVSFDQLTTKIAGASGEDIGKQVLQNVTNLQVTVAELTPTPSPTATPVPTSTPIPTANPTPTPIPTATVSVNPATSSIQLGNTVSVNVNVANGINTGGYQFILSYNPSVLRINAASDVTNGAYLANSGKTVAVCPTCPQIDNVAGTVYMMAYLTDGLNSGANGNGTLATITFTTIGTGTSSLNLSNVQVVMADLDANTQPTTINNSSVQVTSTPTPTPVPTPSPTPTPVPTPSPSPSPSPTPSPTLVPSPSPSPSPTPTPIPVAVNIKFALQGIIDADPGKVIQMDVTLTQGALVIDKPGVRAEFVNVEPLQFVGPNNEQFVTNYVMYKLQTDITDARLDPDITTVVRVKGPMHLSRAITMPLNRGLNTVDFTVTSPKVLLAGDIVNNNTVDIFDFNLFVEHFGSKMPAGGSPADLNMDGVVDVYDFGYIPNNFNKTGE